MREARSVVVALVVGILVGVFPSHAGATPTWTQVAKVPRFGSTPPGYTPGILDADAGRILYTDTNRSPGVQPFAAILDPQTGQSEVLRLPGWPRKAMLTPDGAIVLADNPATAPGGELSLWKDQIRWYHEAPVDSLVYEAPYAVWSRTTDNQRLFQSNFAGFDFTINNHISTTAKASGFDAAANGDVAYVRIAPDDKRHIYRLRDDTATRVSASKPNRWETFPKTDGLHVVYRTGPPSGQSGTWSIASAGDSGETVLGPTIDDPTPDQYQVADGWTAWIRRQAGVARDVVLTDPQGASSTAYSGQQTATGLPVPIALNPKGQAVVDDNSGASPVPYMTRAGASAAPLPPALHGNARGVSADWVDWIDGVWYAAKGDTLYKLTTDYLNRIAESQGLIAWWRLGDTSGVVAKDELGGHNGLYQGDVQHGAGDSAILGDGDPSTVFTGGTGRIKLQPLGALLSFTVEAWSKLDPSASQNPHGNNAIIGGTKTFRLIARPSGVYADLTANDAKHAVMEVSTPTNVDRWVHWALVRAGSRMTLYRNGIVVAITDDAPLNPTKLDAYLGAVGSTASGATVYPLHGELDEVTVYDRALSAEKVQAHYRAGWG